MRFFRTTLQLISYLLLGFIWVACDSETDDEVTDFPDNTNLCDPALNQFVITSEDELITGLDAATGELQPVFEFSNLNEIASLPDYHNSVVYVATEDNAINAIDVNRGEFLWDVPMPEHELSSLTKSATVYDDGMVYCMGHTGVMVAVDATTGEPKWVFSFDPSGEFDGYFSSGGVPVIRGNLLYMLTEEDLFGYPAQLYVLDKKTGELINQLELPNDYTGTLTFAGNTLLLPAGDLYALDSETFEIQWQTDFSDVSSPSVVGDKVLVHAIPPAMVSPRLSTA